MLETDCSTSAQQLIAADSVECRVCRGVADRRHYGVPTCNACAAFFRRAISQRRSYFCSRKNCDITESNGTRLTCKSCRLQKCFAAGMITESLWRRRPLADEDQFSDLFLLQRTLSARQAAFVNKVGIMESLSQKYNKRMELGALKPDLDQSELSKESEFEVLLLFMRSVGFDELDLTLHDQVRIAGRVYYRWLFLSSVNVTLRNGGHHDKMVYFSDRGHIPVTFEDCYDFLHRHQLKDVNCAASFGYEMLQNGIKVGQRFHAARLDKVEFSTLTALMILREAQEMFPRNASIGRQFDTLFRQMRRYYEENYADVALRLGNLILLLNDVNEIQSDIHQFAHLLALSGYDVILPRLLRRYGVL